MLSTYLCTDLVIIARNIQQFCVYYRCKDSICIDLKFVLGSNIKGPNNKFVESELKDSHGERTVVSHGIHDDRIGVN